MPANIYKTNSGQTVPGVTTIIGQLDKPALIQWAWNLGKEGKDWKEQRDSAGDIGTLVHEAVMRFLREQSCEDIDDDRVGKCYDKFVYWWADIPAEPRLVEIPLVSERLQFGGQPDLIYRHKGKLILCDIKTSNGIYDSFWLQLAGYDILLRENGYKVDEYQILWLPKDDRFGCPIRTDLRKEKKIFKHLLEIYQLRRE